jgi:hypothetical protein
MKHKYTKSQGEKDESQINFFIKIQNICHTQKKKHTMLIKTL